MRELVTSDDGLDAIGYIRLEKTGKSQSFVVYVNRGVCSVRVATIGVNFPNSWHRAKAELGKYKPLEA